jgi:hypothetical protein
MKFDLSAYEELSSAELLGVNGGYTNTSVAIKKTSTYGTSYETPSAPSAYIVATTPTEEKVYEEVDGEVVYWEPTGPLVTPHPEPINRDPYAEPTWDPCPSDDDFVSSDEVSYVAEPAGEPEIIVCNPPMYEPIGNAEESTEVTYLPVSEEYGGPGEAVSCITYDEAHPYTV